MDVHLRNLRYFVTVAEELHVTRAAERLHVSQPAVSKQISQLERDIRLSLFRRTRRRVELTAAGEALLPAARRLLADWDQALNESSARASEEEKVLRAGFQTSVGGGLYQAIAARFAELHSDWKLEFRLHTWSDPTCGLLDQSADVAFLWLPIGAEDTIEAKPLRSERRFVALPTAHPLAQRKALHMAQLLDEPFIALPEDAGPLRDYWLALDARNGSPARIGAVAASPDATFEAVASGHGVVLLAEGNTTVYSRPGIVYRPVIDLEPCQLAIAWRRGDRRDAVRDLVKASMSVATHAEHDRVRQTHEDVSGTAP
jgi:DNA-binding transcriptional LysR family regulator